jgi:LPS export ABC transporter permease LptG/LPS export ABC transporter permease LptF
VRILSRSVFREIATGALLGVVLFTFVLFLREAGQLFSILVRSSAPPRTVGYLFWLALPDSLIFTIPLGVVAGVLLGLSRMSGDSEITALRAAGVPGRAVSRPVFAFAAVSMALAAACSLWLTPWSIRERFRILNQLAAAQLTADIQPRVFEEEFPKKVLYVQDVIPGAVVRWRNVFLADTTPPEERPKSAREVGEGPRITVAAEAIATPDVAHNRIQLSLVNWSSYDVEKDITKYNIIFAPKGEQVLDAQKPAELKSSRPSRELDTGPLYSLAYRTPHVEPARLREARIELHRRFALPLACIMLALIGIPLGVSSRKGGKSGAFVITVALAFLYYMGLMSLVRLADQGVLNPALAAWLPNIVFGLAGLLLMSRLETPGDKDWAGRIRSWIAHWIKSVRLSEVPEGRAVTRRRLKFPILPQLVDGYVLTTFLFYFGLLLSSFVVLIHVFTFSELLSDITKNHIPISRVAVYLFFLTPKLIYDTTPISVLVAVLITFGVLMKSNEVTALKACGVSLYRLAVPVLLASGGLSAGLFAFDHFYIPDANKKQDAIRNEIKGRPPQTYLRPDRKWIRGEGDRIYYYRYMDAAENVMIGVSVFELSPKTFRVTRHIQAEKARWEPSIKTWVFQNGWVRDINGIQETNFKNFSGQAMTFPELDEPPSYFRKEVKQYFQMNAQALEEYILDLQQSGFNTIPLQVQLHRKFSVPMFAVIMALISVPFSFLAGTRGAMAGVGVSFGIAIAYFSLNALFEQIGNLNQLPPQIAAWSPDALFSLAGLYFFTRMRT